jgi:hypothetical protein
MSAVCHVLAIAEISANPWCHASVPLRIDTSHTVRMIVEKRARSRVCERHGKVPNMKPVTGDKW